MPPLEVQLQELAESHLAAVQLEPMLHSGWALKLRFGQWNTRKAKGWKQPLVRSMCKDHLSLCDPKGPIGLKSCAKWLKIRMAFPWSEAFGFDTPSRLVIWLRGTVWNKLPVSS